MRISKTKFLCLFSTDLNQLIVRKNIMHRRFKSSSNPDGYTEFCCLLRTCCKNLSINCHNGYIWHINDTILQNTRCFWSFVNSSKLSDYSMESYYLNNKTENTPGSICNLFGDHLSAVYRRDIAAVTDPNYFFLYTFEYLVLYSSRKWCWTETSFTWPIQGYWARWDLVNYSQGLRFSSCPRTYGLL